ncbi:MAG: biotin transporter BioY [Janthinobacterium lividum]
MMSPSSSVQIITETPTAESRSAALARQAALALVGSLLVAVCAHVAIPLPFTPIPFTLQPFAVLLVGMALGPVAGFAALAMYLCEGAAGLPVFTPLGLPGIARLLGPAGGYLWSYPVAAAIAGSVSRPVKGYKFATYVATGAAAMLTVYCCGTVWFSHLLHISLGSAFRGTVVPFAASDAVKVLVAAAMASTLKLRGDRAQQG